MLVELTQWIDHQKKIAKSLTLGNNKVPTCYLRLVIDFLLRKWSPFSRIASQEYDHKMNMSKL
jgi:hypothetical protein